MSTPISEQVARLERHVDAQREQINKLCEEAVVVDKARSALQAKLDAVMEELHPEVPVRDSEAYGVHEYWVNAYAAAQAIVAEKETTNE